MDYVIGKEYVGIYKAFYSDVTQGRMNGAPKWNSNCLVIIFIEQMWHFCGSCAHDDGRVIIYCIVEWVDECG